MPAKTTKDGLFIEYLTIRKWINPPQVQLPYKLITHPLEIFATTEYTLPAETHSFFK